MANDTWNFPTWSTGENTLNTPPQNQRGDGFEFGPASWPNVTTQPFADSFLMIGAFFIRTGWSAATGTSAKHGYVSIGVNSGALHLSVGVENEKLRLTAGDRAIYDVFLGDEDGTNWIQADKWYQFAVSMDGSGISYAINGTDSPKKIVDANSPAALSLDASTERVWFHAPLANWAGDFNPIQANSPPNLGYPSLVFGPCLMDSSNTLDFSNSATLNRIFDTNGDLKYPGKDGSLWLSDSYGSVQPDFYLPGGSLWHNEGTWGGSYEYHAGPSGSPTNHIGGLRKQYE